VMEVLIGVIFTLLLYLANTGGHAVVSHSLATFGW